ncbi:MAG TPA: methylated-DNA--[protein]-cysteine S-methyltransferase [Microbacteriaceae bacterium]
MIYSQTIDTPAGALTVRATDEAITNISFESTADSNPNRITQKACLELDEYFKGQRISFDLPIKTSGTEFQKQVWNELLRIPAGKTTSYGQIAKNIGKPRAARAVGGAVGSNPIAIVIPCHRVMATSGAITGYTGGDGIKTKQKLLDLETVG